MFSPGPAPRSRNWASGDGSFLANYAKTPPRGAISPRRRTPAGPPPQAGSQGPPRRPTPICAASASRSALFPGIPAPAAFRLRPAHLFSRPVAQAQNIAKKPPHQRTLPSNRRPGPSFPAASFILRTDDADYFNQDGHGPFATNSSFRLVETPRRTWAAVVTDFERNFLARGVANLARSLRPGGLTVRPLPIIASEIL